MNKFAIALLATFLPAWAGAVPCPQSAAIPCTPDATAKKSLLENIAKVTQMKSGVDGALLEWSIAQKNEDKEAELAAYENYVNKSAELQNAADLLLESIGESYGVAPLQKSGYSHRPTTPAKDMRWMEGLKTEWKPKLSFSDFDFRSYKAKDGFHYAAVNTVSAAGYTLPDGEVVIPYQLLLDAAVDKNPGVIAQTLYHEGKHFTNLITTGWSYREDEEVAAYSSDVAVQDTFELSPAWRKVQNENLSANLGVAANRKTTSYSSTPKEQLAIKAVVEAQQTDQVNLAKYYQDLKSKVDRSRREQEDEQRRAVDDMLRRGSELQPAPLHPEIPGDSSSGPAPLFPDRPVAVPQPIKDPEGSDQITQLRVISLIACDAGRTVSDQQLSEVEWSKLRGISNIERGLADLSPCEARVYSRLAEFARNWSAGMTITGAEVRAAALGSPAPGSGGGRDCRRNGDPFGCQPRR